MKKGNKWIVIIAVAFVSFVCSYLLFSSPDCESEPCEVCECEECSDVLDLTIIEEGIKEISELNTAQYYFEHERVINNTWDLETELEWISQAADFISETSYNYVYTGYVNAYISFDEVKVEQKLGKIKISIPHAKLSDVVITDYSFTNEKKNLVNEFTEEEKKVLVDSIKEDEYKTAEEKKLTVTAEENAEKQITNFLKMFGDKISKYEIEIIFY